MIVHLRLFCAQLYRDTYYTASVSFINLAVIADDKLAPAVLVAWKSLDLTLDATNSAQRISEFLAVPVIEVMPTLRRCRSAGLLLDGDITKEAVIWVETMLAGRLPRNRRKS